MFFMYWRSLNMLKRYQFCLIIGICCVLFCYILIGNYVVKLSNSFYALTNYSYIKTQSELQEISKNAKVNVHNYSVQINYKVHIFYYAWYANPVIDGEYRHWNYIYLPTWNKNDHNTYPTGHHYPPADIGSNYYPTLGCYSSNDLYIIDFHMKLMKESGIGVIVLSWKPPNLVDSPHDILKTFFDIAGKYKLKVALHVEPYKNRTVINLQENLRNFIYEFGKHTSLYKIKKDFRSKELPVIYIYDSYLIPAIDWKEMFSTNGKLSVRNTDIDGIYIGLLADLKHKDHIKNSQFDGFYTYFASNGFTYGSSWKNWRSLMRFAYLNKLTFIPSVGPGYIDTQVRPWNSENTKYRRHGQYYNMSWKSAIENRAKFISITSFNEWHEGTQIEPASPKMRSNFQYLDYEPEGPYFYMNLTKQWINTFNINN